MSRTVWRALDAIEPRWIDEILDEMIRNVTADYPDIDPAQFVEHTVGSIRRTPPALDRIPAPTTKRRMCEIRPLAETRSRDGIDATGGERHCD